MMRVTMLAITVVTILAPIPAVRDKAGQPFDLEDFAVVFVAENGRTTAVEWRGINERVAARGAKQ